MPHSRRSRTDQLGVHAATYVSVLRPAPGSGCRRAPRLVARPAPRTTRRCRLVDGPHAPQHRLAVRRQHRVGAAAVGEAALARHQAGGLDAVDAGAPARCATARPAARARACAAAARARGRGPTARRTSRAAAAPASARARSMRSTTAAWALRKTRQASRALGLQGHEVSVATIIARATTLRPARMRACRRPPSSSRSPPPFLHAGWNLHGAGRDDTAAGDRRRVPGRQRRCSSPIAVATWDVDAVGDPLHAVVSAALELAVPRRCSPRRTGGPS